jgi:hypothetical protein
MTRWLSALCALAAGTALLAAEDKKAAGDKTPAKIQVISLTVSKAPPPKPGTFMFRANGVTMEVMVSLPGHFITGVDVKASKLDRFTDDKDYVLFKKGGGLFGMGSNWLNEYGVRFDPEGESVTVTVQGTDPPGKGAEKILLKGSLNVSYGSDEKATDKKEMAKKPKEEIDMNPFKVRVSEFGQIEVLSNAENIKKVEFFDDKGKPITAGQPGRSRMESENEKPSYKYSYFLIGKYEKLSVKIHYFAKVETVKVPLDLRVGLGLE